MAASQRSETTTASTCAAETARGTHVFKVAGYSLHKGIGVGKFLRSATFAVGGYDWSILYYPDGVKATITTLGGLPVPAGRVVVYLELMSWIANNVRALFEFRLVDRATGQATAIQTTATRVVLFRNKGSCWGTFSNKNASEIEASSCLRDDCLIVQCDVTVIKEPLVKPGGFEVRVPPSDLLDNLGKLRFEEGMKGADVAFKVKDTLFPAHKIVLAMRSPVFDAQLYGPMADKPSKYLTIGDMHPYVFKALLHFVYTDSMPCLEEFDDATDKKEMVRHLLVAADRYGMERLKLICEGILCKSIGVEDVATSLALADTYFCHNLRNACVAFNSSLNRRSSPACLLDMLGNVSKCLLRCLPLG
ncbi:unnamed protein product [Urochloa decumbens]|uniref:Uncharacterized protein n=1 Tax=Urochloa decumbens TaxID=240449 RepID=A0ABC9DWH7_9POAL